MLRELLIRQYPREWRDRYGDEILAVLEAAPLTPAGIVDTLRGAVDAHVNQFASRFKSRPKPVRRRRPSALVVLTVALTLAVFPIVIRGPRRRLFLAPAYLA